MVQKCVDRNLIAVDQINDAIIETVRRNEHDSCYIRPLIFRGAGPLGVEGRKNPVDVVIFTMIWGRYLGQEAIENGARAIAHRRTVRRTILP